MKMQTPQGIIRNAGEGEQLQAPGITCTFKITGDDSGSSIGVYELVLQPRQQGARLHFHRRTTETFIVTEGTLTLQKGEEIVRVSAGSVVHIPAGVLHAFGNTSDEVVSVFLLFHPARNREAYFRAMYRLLSETPVDYERLADLNAEYDTYQPAAGTTP